MTVQTKIGIALGSGGSYVAGNLDKRKNWVPGST